MNKEILKLAIPNILSNIAIPMQSSIDTIIMGRFSAGHIAAIGIGSMIFNFLYWNFGFLRMGTTGLTAQSYGAQDESQIGAHVGRGIFLALLLGLVILLFQSIIEKLGFGFMSIQNDQYQLVAEYYRIRIVAAPATLCLFVLMGWFFGMQNAVYPLILTFLTVGINIILNLVFVYKFHMEVQGLALATVIAQYVGLIVAVIMLLHKYQVYVKHAIHHSIFRMKEFGVFLSLNLDIFIRTVCLTIVFALFYKYSSVQGTTILAINVILLQFVNWMSYGVDGFAFAAESLVGKYKGKGDRIALHKAIKLSFIWGSALAILYSLIYLFLGNGLLKIFTNDAQLILGGKSYLVWMYVLPLIAIASYIWDGIFVGLTASKAMLWSMLTAFLVFVSSSYFLIEWYANHGLWLMLLLFLFARGIIQTIQYIVYKENLI